MTKKDAEPFWARLEEVEALDERAAPCRVVISDITERKLAERMLFEQNQRLQALLRALPVGVGFSDDLTCERITGNPVLLAQFDARPADNLSASAPDATALGRRIRYVREGRRLGITELPLHRAVREGRTIPPIELDVELPSGRQWFAEFSTAPIRGEGGAVVGGVSVVADVTARKQAQEKEHEQKLKEETLSGGPTAGERASLEELMGRQVRVLRRLVDDLLDISRIKHGLIRLQKEPIDLADLLRVAAAPVQPDNGTGTRNGAAAALRAHVVPSGPSATEKIIANLLDNASKYTDRGGRIELSGVRGGSEVVIRCKDSGRGIPPDMQQKIFTPLTRLEMAGASSQGGLGIGLTLVKRLAELHGGTVSVEGGGPGTGSEFAVRLPFVEAAPVPCIASEAALTPRLGRALSIVFVEDNPDIALPLARTLERAGHRVSRFADGPSALSGVVGLKPDAVLLDIGLPGMDGYELAAKMKTMPNLRSAFFIGISGFKKRAEKSGEDFDHDFVKPVDRARLLTLLDTRAREGAADIDKAGDAPKGTELWRVLLVEDNADLAFAMERLLRREGIEARTALSGQEALEAAPWFQPHLILCDMSLPDMGGLEVIRKLRSGPEAQETHAVMVTARSESEIRAYNRQAKEMGIEEFISKPVTLEVVRRLIAKLKTRSLVP